MRLTTDVPVPRVAQFIARCGKHFVRFAFFVFACSIPFAPAGAADGDSLAVACMSCHGVGGISSGSIPSLAGRDSGEMVRQMHDFASGARPGTVMNRVAKGYSDEQIVALAQYFNHLRAP